MLLSANPCGGVGKSPQWLLLKTIALTLRSFPFGTSRVHHCHIMFNQNAYSLLFLLLRLCCSQWFHSAIKVLYVWRTNRNSARTDCEILFTFVSLNYFLHQFSSFPNCHTAQHGRLFHPEWKPGVWPGPVAYISNFYKVCHHAGRRWSLEGRPSVCLVSVTYFLARLWLRNSHSYQMEKNRSTLEWYHVSNGTFYGKRFENQMVKKKSKTSKMIHQ